MGRSFKNRTFGYPRPCFIERSIMLTLKTLQASLILPAIFNCLVFEWSGPGANPIKIFTPFDKFTNTS